MKTTFALFLAAALLAPSLAHAGDVNQRPGWLGAAFELLPSGTITIGSGNNETSSDTDTAYAVDVIAASQIDDLVSIGLAPRYVFNVNTKNSNSDSSSQLDLRAHVEVGHTLVPKLRLFGFAEPGWSIVFIPQSVRVNNQTYHPNGFVIDVGGGLSYELNHSVRAFFDVGYQWGFQSTTITTDLGPLGTVTTDVTAKDNYLQLGFGLAAAID